jgi:probable F420-dependent oxidoreductase
MGRTVGGAGVEFGALYVHPDDVAEAETAEAMGYDSIWLAGHLFWFRPTADVLSSMAWVARGTSRVKVGSAILLLPLYNALTVAKSMAQLDVLSGGRLILGVGVGGEEEAEFRAAGVDVHRRGRIMDEQLELLRRLWERPREAWSSASYELTERLELLPRPVQARLPIWVGGRSQAARRRAARIGDGYFPHLVTPDQWGRMRREVLGLLAAAGRDADGFAFPAVVFVCQGSTRAEARAQAIAEIEYTYGLDGSPIVDRYYILGDASECRERFQEYIDAGVRHFVVHGSGPGGNARARYARLMDEVIAHLGVEASPV